MLDERMEALALSQHGLISHGQALAIGLTESAIRHRRSKGRLVPVLTRVYRLPGFVIVPVVVTISRRWRRPPSRVRVEQSLAVVEHHRRVVDGIPCTSLARTLFDLCGDVRPGRSERALDTALARRAVTIPALWRVLDDLAEHGREGTVLMRRLLMERGGDYVPPASELEARFVELARAQGLPAPKRQVNLGDDDSWIGRVDFVFDEARLVVEVDSAEFHDGLLDRRRDVERDRRLEADGWTVLRFRWHDVLNRPDDVARSIRFRYAIASSQRRDPAPKQA